MRCTRVSARLPVVLVALLAAGCAADGRDPLGETLRRLGGPAPLTEARIAQGLQEALRVGTGNAVVLTGRQDGYFANPRIRIPMPAELANLERTLRQVGLGQQVDQFVLSMNRAAERAAPQAKQIFWNAIAGMTFDDARKILNGGDTAATDFFRAKTSTPLYSAFRPVVDRALDEVGVTRQYKSLVARYSRIPFVKQESLDIDHYVTSRALDGLFLVLADEERKIRTDPAARVTELLREVFGR